MNLIVTTVTISSDELERIARKELGLEAPRPATVPSTISRLPYRSADVEHAIGHVIRATEKFDQDQYSPGEGSAATALFEAGKRLRKAVAEEHKTNSERGFSNV